MLADPQGHDDQRNLPIERVGISRLTIPLTLQTTSGAQPTVATAALSVALPADERGSHLSRFIPLLESLSHLDYASLKSLTQTMLQKLEAKAGTIELVFPYFRWKAAPISGERSRMNYDITLLATQEGARYRCQVRVDVPVTSLCPCSKAVSAYGAHNQRSRLVIDAEVRDDFLLETLIPLAEASASSQLYGVLKRSDEKFVTEHAYDHPKFVEDLVRDTALAVLDWRKAHRGQLGRFVVEAENLESIHNHSAFARLECKEDDE